MSEPTVGSSLCLEVLAQPPCCLVPRVWRHDHCPLSPWPPHTIQGCWPSWWDIGCPGQMWGPTTSTSSDQQGSSGLGGHRPWMSPQTNEVFWCSLYAPTIHSSAGGSASGLGDLRPPTGRLKTQQGGGLPDPGRHPHTSVVPRSATMWWPDGQP